MAPSDHAEIYVKAFNCMKSGIDVDWKKFASEMGITLAGNAQRKFKETLKKDGYQLVEGKIEPLEEGDETPKKPTKTKTKARAKSETNDDDDDKTKKPKRAKKAKKAEPEPEPKVDFDEDGEPEGDDEDEV